jgi:hypothetical protein
VVTFAFWFIKRAVFISYLSYCFPFHYSLGKSKKFALFAKKIVSVEIGTKKMDTYPFLFCEQNVISLNKVAKATKEAEKL